MRIDKIWHYNFTKCTVSALHNMIPLFNTSPLSNGQY